MTKHELVRALTLKDAVGVGLGAIIGAGIFVVTGVAAGVSGAAFLVGLVVAGIIATFNGLSSAQLAAVYPQSGGTYEYGYRLLSPAMGFSAGWMFLLSKLSAAGVVAIGFGSYFYQLVPVLSPMFYSVSAVVLLTLANYFGIQKAGKLNLIIVSVTLLSLIYLFAGGITFVQKDNFVPFAPFGLPGVAESAALLFFAFTGYARIATLAEEVKEPEKTIPRAVIITIISAIILYAGISVVAVGVIGYENMAGSSSPLQVVASNLSAPGINMVVTIGASTAMLGVLLSQILGISRMLLAMGRRNDLPTFFEQIHSRYKVPHIGIIFTGFVILLLTWFGTFEFIVRSATFTILLYYSIANLSAIKQPKHEQLYGKAIPILGLIGCLAMSVALPLQVIISGIALLLVGFGVRWIIRRSL
ncbi:APC family permease [Natronoflexus pectinivorans]|uniref:APA family basic amino acid/polyamine antiporter n=1 Tax=Natronoflexus pectinivorans TaxID=682526 RepID=A0A4R2GAJ8_9BACT|nr:amino acid permease [Natronoflexus pectinivorans]TCO04978.1 APA family basic amino acid/polyamine antiporter [Natronoflexus pectinivorans]